jgi:hypothetical protein
MDFAYCDKTAFWTPKLFVRIVRKAIIRLLLV